MMLVAICLVVPQRLCLSGAATEIWRLKDNGVTTLTFGVTWRHWSRDHSTPGVNFLWVVHSDSASIWHRYGDMAVWTSSRKAFPGTLEQRSVVRRSVPNITLILYTLLHYVRNVACEE